MSSWFSLVIGLAASSPATASEVHASEVEPEFAAALRRGDPLADAEAKRQERLKALEASQSKQAARVVVLQWKEEPADYTNDTLIRMVKSRIARPDAKFYPDVDIYQEGRKQKSDGVKPSDEAGSVPAGAIAEINAAVAKITPVGWDRLSESEWGEKANELRELANKIWFVDRPELREPLFKLYIQIGRAAENQNNPSPPYYDMIGGRTVNYYWYLAGAMAHDEPALMKKVPDPDLATSVEYYKELLDSKQIKKISLSFEDKGDFDPKKFASDFQVFINGVETLIDNANGIKEVAPGRVDIYLKRTDGSQSLSDSIDITKLEGKVYFVRDVARKKMGFDLIDQLMEHPNECSPEVDSEIVKYLSIYANLHKDAEIYVAVPEAGQANKVLVWRWDRKIGALQKVLDNTGGFPVRFAVVGSTGMAFNGASVDAANPAPPELKPAMVPFDLQLRGHIGRLMLVGGVQGGLNVTEAGEWEDHYQISGASEARAEDGSVVYKNLKLNRLNYAGIGVVLMKEAALGLGPRGYAQVGTFNVPHTVDVSVHAGYTKQGPLGGDARVRSLLDAELFGGMMVPYGDSLLEKAAPNFGLKAGVGLTF